MEIGRCKVPLSASLHALSLALISHKPFFFYATVAPFTPLLLLLVLHASSSAVVVGLFSSLLLSSCCFAAPDYLHRVWPRLRHRSRIRTRESVIVFGLLLPKSDSQPITGRLASFLVLGWPGGRYFAVLGSGYVPPL